MFFITTDSADGIVTAAHSNCDSLTLGQPCFVLASTRISYCASGVRSIRNILCAFQYYSFVFLLYLYCAAKLRKNKIL